LIVTNANPSSQGIEITRIHRWIKKIGLRARVRSDLGMEREERRGGTELSRSACLRCLLSRVIETIVLFLGIINRNWFYLFFLSSLIFEKKNWCGFPFGKADFPYELKSVLKII
jgi:hypothetical protein